MNHYASFLARQQHRAVTEDDLTTAYSLLNELRLDGRLLPASTSFNAIRSTLYNSLSDNFEINNEGYQEAARAVWNLVMLGEPARSDH